MSKIKNYISRFIKGMKLGLKYDFLPISIRKFHMLPLIRIFRIMGGICILIVVSSSLTNFKEWYYIIKMVIIIMAMLESLYIMFISFIKVYEVVKGIKEKKYEVRNSPLDRLGSVGQILIYCFQGTCGLAVGTGTVLTLGISYDHFMTEVGRDPMFIPAVSHSLNYILTELGYPHVKNSEIMKHLREHEHEMNKLFKNMGNIVEDAMRKSVDIDNKGVNKAIDYDELKKVMAEQKAVIDYNESKILTELKMLEDSRKNVDKK